MKRIVVDKSIERRIVTGMVVNDKVLQEIETIYNPTLLKSPYARTVADWCLQYFKEYHKAPGNHIQDIYESSIRKGMDNDLAELIGDFLESISEEHDRGAKFNANYLLDTAEEYFKKQSISMLTEDVRTALIQQGTREAEVVLSKYKLVERPKSKGINIFDQEIVRGAFDTDVQPLFQLPGDLGREIGPFERDTLVGIMGPEKRGKTFWLMEISMRALRSRCNVAFFQVGDLSEGQQVRRFHIYISQRNYKKRYCGQILIPVLDCSHNQTDVCEKQQRTCTFGVMKSEQEKELIPFDEVQDYKPCTACQKERRRKKTDNELHWKGAVWYEERIIEPLAWQEAYKEGQRWMERVKGKQFRLSVHANSSISVKGICQTLDIWERFDTFVPDVIVIDYADILAPEDSRKEFRHQQNDSWAALRRLSQERHCCVVTATQADSQSYGKKSIGLSNFSEDKRKYAHVTMMLGLNQTFEEKKRGIMRISQMIAREEDFDILKEITVLQCLKIGRPYLTSYI